MRDAARSVVIHAHFYQPPREDPWLDEVPEEPSAAPFHDWNERIERECYRAVVAARLPGAAGRIARIVNTLSLISFDVGPTLLEWLEREAPATYGAILEADRVSRDRHGGHGNAIAMPYHHAILPLSSRRDKITEVRWGIADFRRRFRREPEGMWLPEAAVDAETLDVLAAEGIRFTIVGPSQVERVPAGGLPARHRTTNGRSIAVFVYDGPISHDVAFGTLLRDARSWSAQLLGREPSGPEPSLVMVATDGETFGHHHRFGEMALASVLEELGEHPGVRVENCATVLAQHPPQEDVELVFPSSWSCPHGVERWRADCGCRMGTVVPSQQRWRAPLREALDWLAAELHTLFEREAGALLREPWEARDGYGAVMDAGPEAIARFVSVGLRGPSGPDESIRARELLELERNALRMFTSCGWFFDDIGGIEALQVLRYAARAIELTGSEAERLEAGLLERLALALSNDRNAGSGRDLYLRSIKPRVPPAIRYAGGYMAVRTLVPEAVDAAAGSYQAQVRDDSVVLTHRRTGRAERFQVMVERPGLARISLVVSSPNGAAELTLSDLPERQRRAVAIALRRAVVTQWLTPVELNALAAGEADSQTVTTRALVKAVEDLEHDHSAAATAKVLDLADLLELLGRTVPFDAQTAFYRLRVAASRERADALGPVARRLGFVVSS